MAEKTMSLLEKSCRFSSLCPRKWKILCYIQEAAQWNRRTCTRRFKYSTGGNNKDFLPFLSLQDQSSLLKPAPARCAVCHTTWVVFIYKNCILLPLGNSFCLNTYLQITKSIAGALKTTNCCNNSELCLWLHSRLINPKFMPQQRFHFMWKKKKSSKMLL